MRLRRAIGLVLILAASAVGCGAPSRSRVSSPPRSAHGATKTASVQRRTTKSCCSPLETNLQTESPASSSPCNEVDQLQRQFSDAKPIRVFSGKATYYSDSLAGHAMASGELYQPGCAQAAHRTLPFGSIVRVRVAKTGASVVVRIADRGPYAGRGRIIDLSYEAARTIGLIRAGVADVRVEVLRLPEKR